MIFLKLTTDLVMDFHWMVGIFTNKFINYQENLELHDCMLSGSGFIINCVVSKAEYLTQ